MSDNISKISEDFKELVELKIQNQTQFKVISNLTRINQDLQKEIEHLKGMLDKTVPIISPISSLSPEIRTGDEPEADICRMEILKLRTKSLSSELTFEDAKKLETFTKVLNASKNIPKIMEIKTKKMNENELIALIDEPESINERN